MKKLSLGVPETPLIKPLLHGLDQHPGVQLETASYAALAEGLSEERYDCALLPPWMAWTTFGVRFVPGIGVSAMEAPGIENLFAADDWQDLKRVFIMPQEEHLRPVLQLLYAEYGRSTPHWEMVETPRWELKQGEGFFCGDERTSSRLKHWALADLWREETGLPWVSYAWVAGFRAPYARLRTVLTQAWQAGLAALQESPEQYAPTCHRVSYRLASLESDGLRQLAALARRHEIAVPEGDIIFC